MLKTHGKHNRSQVKLDKAELDELKDPKHRKSTQLEPLGFKLGANGEARALMFEHDYALSREPLQSVRDFLRPSGSKASLRFARANPAGVLHSLIQIKRGTCSTPLDLAEGEGFEPPEAFTSTVFKTAAFDRSANLPYFYKILTQK